MQDNGSEYQMWNVYQMSPQQDMGVCPHRDSVPVFGVHTTAMYAGLARCQDTLSNGDRMYRVAIVPV